MNAEARLAAALGTSAAPAVDAKFTLGVVRAAEAQRFKAEAMLSILRWGAMAAVGASALLALSRWASSDLPGVQNGILGAGAIFALVAIARLMTQRLAPAAVR